MYKKDFSDHIFFCMCCPGILNEQYVASHCLAVSVSFSLQKEDNELFVLLYNYVYLMTKWFIRFYLISGKEVATLQVL